MDSGLLAFMELIIVLGFVLGWAVIELVGLRLDRAREREKEEEEAKARARAAGTNAGPTEPGG